MQYTTNTTNIYVHLLHARYTTTTGHDQLNQQSIHRSCVYT